MLRDIVRGERVTRTDYELVFDDGGNCGFAFPCDEAGNVSGIPQPAMENLAYCRQHPEKFTRAGVVVGRRCSWREPDRGKCKCGRTVYLENQYMGACECECGQWYNLFGQELLPPDQWEDTGYDY